MADVHTLIDRNLEFANNFKQGDLGILPRLSTLIVTCLDARVDPAHLFGLELGDAVVMRNIGGRVTDDLIEQIAILHALAGIVWGGSLRDRVGRFPRGGDRPSHRLWGQPLRQPSG